MRTGTFHDLLWENWFPVQAAVVELVFTVSFVTQSMYLDFRFFCDPVHVSGFSWQDTGTLHGWDMWHLWEKTGFWWKTMQCTHVA